MRIPAAALLAATLVLTAGCWDRREIEERSTALVLGIDPSPQSTADVPLVRVSTQIAVPGGIPLGGVSQAGGSEGGRSVAIRASTGISVESAMNNLQSQLNQELFLGHTRVIGIAEELARQGVEPYVDALRRNNQIRRLLWFVVVRGEALNLVRFTPLIERVPAFYLMDLLQNEVQLGRMGNLFFGEFLIRMSNDGEDPVLPIVEVSDDAARWVGMAVFRGTRMVASLSIPEAWALLQARGITAAGEELIVEIPAGSAIAEIFSRNRRASYHWVDGRLEIELHLRLEAIIQEVTGDIPVTLDGIKQLEEALSNSIEQRLEALIQKAQSLEADIFGFGEEIRAYFPGRWRGPEWRTVFPTTQVRVNAGVAVRRVGMALGP